MKRISTRQSPCRKTLRSPTLRATKDSPWDTPRTASNVPQKVPICSMSERKTWSARARFAGSASAAAA